MNFTNVTDLILNVSNTSNQIIQEQDMPLRVINEISMIIDLIVQAVVGTGLEHGTWKAAIVLFALVGVFAVIAAIGSKISQGLGIVFKFGIALPAICIIGLFNKKKRKARLQEMKWIKEDFKKNSKQIPKKIWIYWIATRLALPLTILGIILWEMFR